MIKPIHTEQDYQRALRRLSKIFDAERGTREGDELEILSILIDHYEQQHEPIEAPDPIEAIKFRMEQLGYTQQDLVRIVGLKSRVSELLNRKRRLTLEMIRKFQHALHIPAEVLVKEYELE